MQPMGFITKSGLKAKLGTRSLHAEINSIPNLHGGKFLTPPCHCGGQCVLEQENINFSYLAIVSVRTRKFLLNLKNVTSFMMAIKSMMEII